MTLTTWNPVRQAALEIEGLDRVFDGLFRTESTGWVPSIDIFETAARDLVVKADLPDMKRDDIKVTLEHDVLTIEGERRVDSAVSRDAYHRAERRYGAFRRSFTLPATVDSAHLSATYQDGVLTVTLPRREESRPRQIQING